MLYNAVIFDLDGTLTDSAPGIMACTRYALEKLNRPALDEATLRRFMGPPLAESFMIHCGMNAEEAQAATEVYRERYIPIGWQENAVFAGIRHLLKSLKEQGVYLAVATGKPEKTSLKILEHFHLLQYFDAVAGPRDSDLHADKAALIGRVLPGGKRAVMIGDTVVDIKGAKQAGIDSVAVLWGYGENADLLAAKPTHVAENMTELCRVLCPDMPPAKGYFISIEGLDGCGKTVQANALEAQLSQFGFPVHRTREPGGCPISEQVRGIVLAQRDNGMSDMTEALLFASARSQHVFEVILPALQAGEVVLCDRFVDSSIAYQGAGRQLGIETVSNINAYAIQNRLPDATLYLRLPYQEGLKRRGSASFLDRIEQQDNAFYARVEAGYERLYAENQNRFVAVDAMKAPEAVTADAMDALVTRMLAGGIA